MDARVMKAFPVVAHVNLANGITSLSVVASLGAVFLAINGYMVAALVAGAITIPCDVLDGVVARRLRTSSAFGAQLDSLSDAIGFGVLPAVLGYGMGIRGAGMLALAAYTLGAVWRLARFHEVGTTGGRDGVPAFQGMPTTFAAGLFYLMVGLAQWMPEAVGRTLMILFFLSSALLMNGQFAFPKTGWHTRLLWALVPAALTALVIRQW